MKRLILFSFFSGFVLAISFPLAKEKGPWCFDAYELPIEDDYSNPLYQHDSTMTSVTPIDIELHKSPDHHKLCSRNLVERQSSLFESSNTGCDVTYDHVEKQGVLTGSECGKVYKGVNVGYFMKSDNTVRVYFALY